MFSQVKYFDRKKIYEEYKKKLDEQGYEPLDIKIQDMPDRNK